MPSSIISLLAAEVEAEVEVEADLDQDQAAEAARAATQDRVRAKVARAKAVIHPAAQAPAKVVRHQEAIPLAAILPVEVRLLAVAIRPEAVTRQVEAAVMVATTSSTIEQFRS